MRGWVIATCGLLVSGVLARPATGTNVTTNITTDTTWSVAGSPYIIQKATLEIKLGSTLTIEPGVEVRFGGSGYRMETTPGASIVAVGTEGDRILFTSNAGTPAVSDWNTVSVFDSPASSFVYCDFEYAATGLYLKGSSDPLVRRCTFGDCQIGIWCEGAVSTIESCSVTQCVTTGIRCRGPVTDPMIYDCNLYENPGYNVSVDNYPAPPGVGIDARHNWWGTAVESEIEETVFHSADDPGVYATVDYGNWYTEAAIEHTSWGCIKALFID